MRAVCVGRWCSPFIPPPMIRPNRWKTSGVKKALAILSSENEFAGERVCASIAGVEPAENESIALVSCFVRWRIASPSVIGLALFSLSLRWMRSSYKNLRSSPLGVDRFVVKVRSASRPHSLWRASRTCSTHETHDTVSRVHGHTGKRGE